MDLSMISTNLDLNKIEPIKQNRTLAFLNHWIHHTIIYLNQFSTICHKKLQKIDEKIQKIDDQLAILENKLSSIPGFDNIPMDVAVEDPAAKIIPEVPEEVIKPDGSRESSSDVVVNQQSQTDQKRPLDNDESITPVSKHPKFVKYFKMIAFGVPEDAVRLKMSAEGLDPDVLKNPNASAPLDDVTLLQASDSEATSDTSWED